MPYEPLPKRKVVLPKRKVAPKDAATRVPLHWIAGAPTTSSTSSSSG